MNKVLQLLSGRKTILGSLLLSLLGGMYFLDVLVNNGTAAWLSEDQYIAAGAFISGLTGVAMRLAIGKVQ